MVLILKSMGRKVKTFKIAISTKTGNYIETERLGTGMLNAIECFIWALAAEHQTLFDEVVELDVTEMP